MTHWSRRMASTPALPARNSLKGRRPDPRPFPSSVPKYPGVRPKAEGQSPSTARNSALEPVAPKARPFDSRVSARADHAVHMAHLASGFRIGLAVKVQGGVPLLRDVRHLVHVLA